MKRKQTSEKQVSPSIHRTLAKPRIGRQSRTGEQLKSILQAVTEFYGTWDVSPEPMHLNGSCLQALGYTGSDLPNRHVILQSLIHAQDRSEFEAQVKAHVAGNTPALDCEFRLRTKGGLFRWFALHGKAIRRDRRGAAVEIAYGVRDIHPVKEQQRELLASREQLTSILEALPDGVSVVDPVEFRLLAFNKAFEDLILETHRVRPKLGMRLEDVAPGRGTGWNTFYRQVLTKGKVSRDDAVSGPNNSHARFGQTLVRDGRVWGICTFAYDVRGRKRAERALRKSEEKFAKAFHSAPIALSLAKLQDSRYIDVNDAFSKATGYSREDLIGKTPSELNLWVDFEQRKKMVEQAQLTGELLGAELEYRTKSGEIRAAMGSLEVIQIEDEQYVMSVLLDITDRKRDVEVLKENEERLRIAIEAGHMYAFEWDMATDMVYRSEQSAALLDFSTGGARRTRQEFIERVLPEDRERYAQSVKSLTSQAPEYKTIFRLARNDGRTVWLEESGRAIFGADGKLRKIIGITTDVTEVREPESALRELSGRLITSQEEERRRIARELHDHIGQETALICVQAQRLDSGVAEQENTMRSDMHELYRKVKVLATDVSKLSHRLHSSELSFLGLSVAAERLCRDFAHQYGIDVDFQGKSIPTSVDGARSLCIYRVLQESLQNVAKHSRASRVIVELQPVQNELVLKVRDNGKGFEVQKTGTGLGLLSMRERVHYLGGRFGITSKPGAGSVVNAQVPV